MIRKIILLIAVIFFMTLIAFTGMIYVTNEAPIQTDEGVELEIEKSTFFLISEPEVSQEGSETRYIHHIRLLGVSVGTYTLVERTLPNDVTILFEEVDNTSWMPYAMSLNAVGLEEAALNLWNENPSPSVIDEIYGEDPTSIPFGSLAWNGHEMLQGNLFISRDLTLGNGTEVQELRHEIPNIEFEENKVQKNFWLPPKHQAQSWMILADTPLFENEETEEEWIEFASNNESFRLNWLRPEGPYVKLPQTDDLRTQMAYHVDLARFENLTDNEVHGFSSSLFYETMILNLEESTQTP